MTEHCVGWVRAEWGSLQCVLKSARIHRNNIKLLKSQIIGLSFLILDIFLMVLVF